MKHLKLFESFKEEDIHSICKNYGIRNYTINEDGSIDVDGVVNLYEVRLTKIPIKFRNVSDYFDCSDNQLTSLEGSPELVGDGFYCFNNKLTTLKYGPEAISGDFNCIYNKLTSLEGCPKSVGNDFYCNDNKIVTFEHLPLLIGGKFYCSNNPIWEIWELFFDYSKIEFLNDCDALREPDADSEEPIIILDRLNYFLEEIGKKAVKRVKGYKCI